MNELTHEQKVKCMIAFINHVGIDEAANFIVHLQNSVEGLTANNQSFIKAYRKGKQ
jgi:hypothetical protein